MNMTKEQIDTLALAGALAAFIVFFGWCGWTLYKLWRDSK